MGMLGGALEDLSRRGLSTGANLRNSISKVGRERGEKVSAFGFLNKTDTYSENWLPGPDSNRRPVD